MALLMIMGLALLVYSLAERKLRQALKEMNASLPESISANQPKRRPFVGYE